MICDLKKVKKLGFFDENFFLYWEDIDLMKRVRNSRFKMIKILDAHAKHHGGKSSVENFKTKILIILNGEFVFELKYKKLRFIKVIRTLFQCIIFIPIYLIIYNQDKLIKYYSNLMGIFKFMNFYFFKRNSLN